MIEAAFPLLGTAFVVLIVLPTVSLFVKAGLVILERDEVGGLLRYLNLRYLVLTGSSLLPLAWFISAGLHQAETGKSVLACIVDHDASALCFEPGFFALALAFAVLASSLAVVRTHRSAQVSSCDSTGLLMARLERIVTTYPSLAVLRGHLVVTDEPDFALGTDGLFKPRVFIGTTFAYRLSDDMLASALGHESEHRRALDPLRYALLQFALAVNPFGRLLLEPHAARWQVAREAYCDREAVIRGAAPLQLADAIVRAARPSARQIVALGARDIAVLKFRIGMLLAFAERAPVRHKHQGSSTFLMEFVLLLIALLTPHQTSTGALDALHTGAERATTYFLR